jgi:transposase
MIRRRRPRDADIESFRDWLFTQLLTPGQFGDRKIQRSLRSPTRVLKDVEKQNPRLNRPAFDAHLLTWEGAFMPGKDDPEMRARAVRLVLEHREDYPSEWAAITAVSKRLGMNAESLRNWIGQQQIDDGDRDGVSSEAAAAIRALRRRNAELEQTTEILKAATSFLVRESDPRNHR